MNKIRKDVYHFIGLKAFYNKKAGVMHAAVFMEDSTSRCVAVFPRVVAKRCGQDIKTCKNIFGAKAGPSHKAFDKSRMTKYRALAKVYKHLKKNTLPAEFEKAWVALNADNISVDLNSDFNGIVLGSVCKPAKSAEVLDLNKSPRSAQKLPPAQYSHETVQNLAPQVRAK
jgi:hypothetical protein